MVAIRNPRWAVLLLLASGLACTPQTFCPVPDPIEPPEVPGFLGAGLDGFDSPYLGHTGSWDGRGGAIGGASKEPDMDLEVFMGLRWTFMPVYWSAMEPGGPIGLLDDAAWDSLDRFVIAAHDRGLNVLFQAPVIGGNAGGPPGWAGRREPGKSAPSDMDAAARFAWKLAQRYRPGGILAIRQGWGDTYGVRAWEMDNEPEAYLTHWDGQAGDYAEFVTRVASRIKDADPDAVILSPAVSGTRDPWVDQALDAYGLAGSPAYRERGMPHSIGPQTDVVSFHIYEGLDSFLGGDRTVECAFLEIRETFEARETVPGFEYARIREYWHTEGNFAFFGNALSRERQAAWWYQFFARAFTAGVRKVVIMDASLPEQVAVRRFVQILPHPHPMLHVPDEVAVRAGRAWAFRHPVGPSRTDGQIWILWADNGSPGAVVDVPVGGRRAGLFRTDGSFSILDAEGGEVRLALPGDPRMSAPVILVDRPFTMVGDGYLPG